MLVPLLAAAVVLGAPRARAAQAPDGTAKEEEAFRTAVDAYVYGYPLVTMEVTRRIATNVEQPEGARAPMGQFVHQRGYPDASFRDVTTPNADTLYSTAWLDLSKEPYVLHVPDMGSRYCLMQFLSGWTDVFADPGTRTTGTKAQDFLVTGPGWKGEVPRGMRQLRSPTNMAWLIGRTYSSGTPEDFQQVHALQAQYALTPLSAWGKPSTPPAGSVDPDVDMKLSPREQVNRMDAARFFETLAALMRPNPPQPADAPLLARMVKIGLIPGKGFDLADMDPAKRRGIERAVQAAQQRIMAHEAKAGERVNGWTMTRKAGTYGTDYLQRAFITAVGLGANLPADALYPMARVDGEGRPLTGASPYVLRFPKGQLPPVNGFWSVTLYDEALFFVPNPLNRYSVSPRNALKKNADGSVDLYVQHDSPGKDKESNWLPAPEGPFVLTMRLYWPKPEVLRGAWKPPPVQRQRATGGSGPGR